jgi:hypothetical protein
MMTQEQFVYWLRGFLSGKDYICSKDVDLLKEELAKVNVVAFSSPTINPPFNPYTPWYDKTTTLPSEGPTCESDHIPKFT